MIELITTAAMLVSSVYGTTTVAQAPVVPTTTQTVMPSPTIASTTISATSSRSNPVAIASTTDSVKDVASFVKSSYADDPVLVKIASCESNFRQYDANGNILRGVENHYDVGVMQINEKYHLDEAVSMGLDIRTTKGNVAFAKYLYDTQGADPWSASQKCWSRPLAVK
jgi:hypothetical protein